MNLYWVTTEDHDEDWFVVADDLIEASTFHEGAEGYNEGDAAAEWVAKIPDGIDADVGWPSDHVLTSCGAKFLREDTPRVVEIAGHKYSEGMLEHVLRELEDDMFEARGHGRPNRTEPKTEN